MATNRYRYAIELYRDDGSNLGQVPVEMDAQPALEWTWLSGLRQNKLELTDGTDASAVRPVFNREVGEPYVEGFKVTILSDEDDGITEDFSTAYFKQAADEARLSLIATKKVRRDETVRYVTLAFLNEAHAAPPAKPLFRSREAAPDIRLLDSQLERFIARSELAGEVAPDDVPIMIPRRILDETRELALASRDKEVGGILIGHLHRDRRIPEVFVEVTAQIPAAHAVADAARLTFTPDTWSAVQAAVDLRGEGETWVSWWHSHVPVALSCKDCPEEKRAVCPLANGFFSQDDRQLHRTVFFKAFATALTVSLKDGGGDNEVTHKLYGWRHGVIEPRGFYVLNNGSQPTGGERDAERQS